MVAELPDQVRGDEQVKLSSVERYRAEQHLLLARFRRGDAVVAGPSGQIQP